MKFSIIIPSYNQADYLTDAIDSALMQTAPCEIIVIDDGSTDKSLQLARQYEKDGVKVISQVNKGLPSARNTGIMNATGEWILPLDADDVLMDDCLREIQKVIDTTDADIVSPSFKTFGTSNEQIILMPNPTIEDFKTGNRVAYCSAIKRSALLEVGGYNPRMIYGWEDYDLWFDLLKRGKKIITIPIMLWLYRTKDHSMIHDANAHAEELWGQIYKNHPEIYAK